MNRESELIQSTFPAHLDRKLTLFLEPQGFQRYAHSQFSSFGCDALWRRRTWNTNRAVALIKLPSAEENMKIYCQKLKWKFLRFTGVIPFFWPLGLQLIVYGNHLLPRPDVLSTYVSKIDNQLVTLQSLFVIDMDKGSYDWAATWAQFFTSKFQESVLSAIKESIEDSFDTPIQSLYSY